MSSSWIRVGPNSNDSCLYKEEEDLRHRLTFRNLSVVVIAVWETDGEESPVLTRQVQSLKAFGRRSQGAPPCGLLSDADSVQSLSPVITNTRSQ